MTTLPLANQHCQPRKGKEHALDEAAVAALLPLGFRWWPWWLWAVALFFLARRHPVIVDSSSLGRGRKWLAL